MLPGGDFEMKKVIIIGSGAGGATVAKELQGKFQVTLLEAGGSFTPFSLNLPFLEHLRSANIFLTEKMIRLVFPPYRISKTKDHMILVNAVGIGGTTTVACGNALRVDAGLKKIGVELDQEFSELHHEIPISAEHEHLWRDATRRLYEICAVEGLKPFPIPKAGHYRKCRNCGHCTLGCSYGVKWNASIFVSQAAKKGAVVIDHCAVKKIYIKNNRAIGVFTNRGLLTADLVIVAAGGFNTPVILENSGIKTDKTLFVDPVLCVAVKYTDALQNNEISMPFAVQMDGYIISPYFDQLSFFFNKKWRIPGKDILSLMIKLADTEKGTPKNKILTKKDRQKLDQGVNQCKKIFSKLGVNPDDAFLGTLNAGHPGGMLPLTPDEASSFHNPRLPENVYVADASLFPSSLGNPPMLTIMALAKRISSIISMKY
jgi:choline dehydrogenase-like flavoprotein